VSSSLVDAKSVSGKDTKEEEEEMEVRFFPLAKEK